jgi:hypothetical protein
MNIFYLDPDVNTCAEMHNDKHCVKMILEYAQLLSTAHRVLDGVLTIGLSESGRKRKQYILSDKREQVLYSATHINHPSAVWVRQSHQNYIWLSQLLESLCYEYTYRYEKTHKVERDGLLQVLTTNIPVNTPIGPFTAPTPAMPDDVKVPGNSLASYRKYYINNKSHLANWKKRQVPEWFNANV